MRRGMRKWILAGMTAIMTAALTFAAAASEEGVASIFDGEIAGGQGQDNEQDSVSQTGEGTLADSMNSLAGENALAGDPVPDGDVSGQDEMIFEALDMAVTIPDGLSVEEDSDGFVTIYADEPGYIPYVIFGRYEYAGSTFFEDFTAMMRESYNDLVIAEAEKLVTAGQREMSQLVYQYSISGYTATDTRLAVRVGNYVYMFGAKEIPELGSLAGDLLYNVAGSFRTLSENTAGGSGTEMNAPAAPSSLPGSEDTQNDTTDVLGSVTFTEESAGFEGVWVPFNDGFKIYLPSEWKTYDLSGQNEDGTILYAAGNYGSDSIVGDTEVMAIVSWVYDESGSMTLEQISQELLQGGVTGVATIDMNGIPCVTFESQEEDLRGIFFFHPSNPQYYFSLMVHPFGNESQEVSDLGSAIMCSLSPYQP